MTGDWRRACPAADLPKKRPHGLQVGDWPIVLFRDAHGSPRALLDRCPHRSVPLSLGKVSGGRLTCCYHGWEFDGAGLCLRIPSNVEPETSKPMATSFEVKEEAGFLWVRPSRPEF